MEEELLNNLFKDMYLLYDRKSTDDANNQKNSLLYQRHANLAYTQREELALATSLTIPGFCTNGIIDESHSAYKVEEEFVMNPDGSVQYRILRPKFRRLVELLNNKLIKGVVFLCWDRASRNDNDSLIIKKLIGLGSDIRFTEATYEKSSAGKLHMNIDGMFSGHYSDVISEKVKGAYVKLRAEGRCLYNSPIGYLDKGSDNKPFDPVRAPTVKRIFELYATGDWSFAQLAKWAEGQGLTKKPVRRKRTEEEKLNNTELESIPKISRPVDRKTIEYMLPNPFYIGKVKLGDRFDNSNAHQALIDVSLFNKVQEMLKKRNVSVYYMDKPFHIYRGLLRCECGRAYSPYEQKGIIYYRSRCKDGCSNTDPNLSEKDASEAIQTVIDNIHFTDNEVLEIERRSKNQLASISAERNKTLNDLQARQRATLADIDYIAQNKITLLRTGSMDIDTINQETKRLQSKLEGINEEIKVYSESATEMLKYILSFSMLVKNAGLYFKHALDSEKREIATTIFTELVFKDKTLVQYKAKEGFDALLSRNCQTCSAARTRTWNRRLTRNPILPYRRGLYLHPKGCLGI
jgi:site-specific DNA recombinase